MALLNTGNVVAWGDGSDGETNVPPELTNVVGIIASGDPYSDTAYSLALKSDGTLVAWGEGEPNVPVAGMSNVIGIGAGADHALAIRTGPATPMITLQPTDAYQVAGGDVTFTARGVGIYGVSYQWQLNGVNLAGKTNATLTVTNVQSAQAGSYEVLVSDNGGAGSIVSSNASLKLVTAPAILSQSLPTNLVVHYQSAVTFSVTASAPGGSNGFPLSYQWQFNGTNLSGATATSYTFPANAGSAGTYSVILTNAAGSTSAAWQVTILYDTLAYHLATNTVSYASGYTDISNATIPLSGGAYDLTNSVWSTNFWLHRVQGLSATCIGWSNVYWGGGLVTMTRRGIFCLPATRIRRLGLA